MTPCASCSVDTAAAECDCAHDPALLLPPATLLAITVAKMRGDAAEVSRLKLDGLARLRVVRLDTTREDSAPMTRPPAHSMFVPAKPYAPEGAARRDATPAPPVAPAVPTVPGYSQPTNDTPDSLAREAYRRRQFALSEAFSACSLRYKMAGVNSLPTSDELETEIDAIVSRGGPRGYSSQATANNAGMNRSGTGSL